MLFTEIQPSVSDIITTIRKGLNLTTQLGGDSEAKRKQILSNITSQAQLPSKSSFHYIFLRLSNSERNQRRTLKIIDNTIKCMTCKILSIWRYMMSSVCQEQPSG